MATRGFKSTTLARREMTVSTFKEIITNKPEKFLIIPLNKHSDRNTHGRITSRHRGGGARKEYRITDLKRNKDGIPGRVTTIEYDSNRIAYTTLINYADGEKGYVLQPVGLKVGDEIESGEEADVKVGDTLKLKDIPAGTIVHSIELIPDKGGQLACFAGTSAQLTVKEGKYVSLRLPSGEYRRVSIECRVTVGQVGNVSNELITFGKAGRKRHMGVHPHVRGSATNPVDHPYGDGEGRTPTDRLSPMIPWGKKALGLRTRKKDKKSDMYIVHRRKKQLRGGYPRVAH